MNWAIYDIDGNLINTIFADEAFVTEYCAGNGYTYEKMPDPEPTPAPVPEPSLEEQVAELTKLVNILAGGEA